MGWFDRTGWRQQDKEEKLIFNLALRRDVRLCLPGSLRTLEKKFGVNSMPICRGDEIILMRGTNLDKEAKVTQVYRKKFIIKTDTLTTKNASGMDVPIPIQPSNVMITNLNMTESRKKIIQRKVDAKIAAA